MKFSKSLIKQSLYSFLLILGVIALVCYFLNANQLDSNFTVSFQQTIQHLLSFSFWQLFFQNYQTTGQNYTLLLISSSLLFVALFFISYAYFYRFLKIKQLHFLQNFFANLETLPVVTLVLFLQWSFISLHKATGLRLLTTIGTPRQPIFLVPFFILTIFPCIFLINYLTPYIKEAYHSDYFLFARSLGFSHSRLFVTYLLPNLIRPLKSVIGIVYLEMVSVMIFIELQFNTGGLITSLYRTLLDFSRPQDAYVFISAYLLVLLLPYVVLKTGFNLLTLRRST
ncbi:ABC transporter permease subunit [Carnobacterium sp.]|uniref:ABC transporter permease subunit n=1 Tax=Carnobacterium sp. TaxID=48221 RepID=UPI002FCB9C5B